MDDDMGSDQTKYGVRTHFRAGGIWRGTMQIAKRYDLGRGV